MDHQRKYTSILPRKSDVQNELAEIAACRRPGTKRGMPTLAAFIELLLRTDWKESVKQITWETYEVHWRTRVAVSSLGRTRIDRITSQDVQLFIDGLYKLPREGAIEELQPLQGETKRRVGSLVSAAFRDAMSPRYGYVKANPALLVRYPKKRATRRPFFDIEKLKRLHEFGEGVVMDMLLVVRDTGLSRSEVCGLLKKNVKQDVQGRWSVLVEGNVVEVSGGVIEQDAPKNEYRVREVPLTQTAAQIVRRQPQRGRHVFTREDGQPIRPDYLTKKGNKMLRAAGIDGMTVQNLRAAFASIMLQVSDIRTTQETLGHSTSKMTQEVYARSNIEARRSAAEKFEERMKETG